MLILLMTKHAFEGRVSYKIKSFRQQAINSTKGRVLSFVLSCRAVLILLLGSVSEFPGDVLSVKLPSLPSGIGLFLEAGLPSADRCL